MAFYCPQYVRVSKIGLDLKVFKTLASFYYIIFLIQNVDSLG